MESLQNWENDVTCYADTTIQIQTENSNSIESQKYMRTKEYLKIGSKNIEDENFLSAIFYYKRGLQELKYCYLSKDIIDDTGNWITVAEIEEREKRFSNAANILKRILTTRLTLYQKRVEKNVCDPDIC